METVSFKKRFTWRPKSKKCRAFFVVGLSRAKITSKQLLKLTGWLSLAAVLSAMTVTLQIRTLYRQRNRSRQQVRKLRLAAFSSKMNTRASEEAFIENTK